jgi:hypothetical protein
MRRGDRTSNPAYTDARPVRRGAGLPCFEQAMRTFRYLAPTIVGLAPLFFALGCSGSSATKAPPAASSPALSPAMAKAAPPAMPEPPPEPASVQRAVHALNRLGYGPRPGEAEAAARAGVDAWVAKQLAPTSIDDSALEAKLGAMAMPSLSMSMAELQEQYPRAGAKKKAAAAAAAAASRGAAGGSVLANQGGGGPTAAGDNAGAGGSTAAGDNAGAGGPTAAGGNAGAGGSTAAKGRVMVDDDPKHKPGLIVQELATQKLVRALASERQLHEVLSDFWYNHFNVFAEKDKARWYVTAYERDVIRKYAFGRFRDLLGATARHPAMLVYLDNFRSVADGAPGKGKARGLNENYARELLELHTLGVEGGYTQADVREVARAFTGWTINQPDGEAAFVFRPRQHDTGPKTVLGTTLYAGGEADGERVLDLLAAHPSTARFIATKLARRFVADTPPPALVDRLAETFQKTGGELSAVYAELFRSPEFWADEARGAKTKTPFEFAASSLRALGANYDGGPALPRRLEQLGEPLYRCQPPTGFSDTAEAWVNAGSLINRLNFGLDVAGGRLAGVAFDRGRVGAGPPPADVGALVDRLAASLLGGAPSAPTRATVIAALERRGGAHEYQEPAATHPLSPQALGLLLGSPEFQKR